MSHTEATAGFRNAGWTMTGLPADVVVGASAADAGRRGGQRIPVREAVRRHRAVHHASARVPRDTLSGARPGSAGYAVFTQTSRSVGNDMRLEHEIALLDVAAGLNFLKQAGFKRIILIGNSGGASLYAFYNQQSLLDAGEAARKDAGRPADRAGRSVDAGRRRYRVRVAASGPGPDPDEMHRSVGNGRTRCAVGRSGARFSRSRQRLSRGPGGLEIFAGFHRAISAGAIRARCAARQDWRAQ